MQIATNSTSTKTDKQGQERTPSLFSDANGADIRRAKAWLDNRFSHGEKAMFSEVITVTPSLAEYILTRCNKNNRPISQSRCDKYVRFIKNGDWKLTSQGISFSKNGVLNNGQHRLCACVLSGVAIELYVTFGEDRDAFEVIDTQGVRGGSDILAIAGYGNTTHLAATARTVKAVVSGTWAQNPTYTNAEILEFTENNPSIVEALLHGAVVAKKLNCSRSAVALAFWLIMTRSKKPQYLDNFRDSLATGSNLNPTLMRLRDGIMQRTIDAEYKISFSRNIALAASIILGWNLFVRGKNGNIKFKPGAHFPEVI